MGGARGLKFSQPFADNARHRDINYIEHGWDLTLKSLFPDESDLDRAEVLDFGVGHDNLMNILYQGGGSPIPDSGIRALAKVLHAARESLGLEFCPLLPDLACLLLSYMPVSSFIPLFLRFFIHVVPACVNGISLLLCPRSENCSRRVTHSRRFVKWCMMILRISWQYRGFNI
jgi:hypothetical protein